MSRKNTILLAVLINAGLLLVLFVAALTSQEELAIAPTHEVSAISVKQDPSPPLFGDELDLTLTRAPDPLPQVIPEKAPEAPVVHVLPPVVSETVVPEAAPKAAPLPEKAAPVAAIIEVTVKKGDTLEKIAKDYRTTVDDIIKLNQLPSSFLRVGQVLKVPKDKAIVRQAPKGSDKREGPDYYTVKVGDNPWTIAMKHHLKVDELLKLNGLNEEKARKLKPGDRLRIR